MTAYMISLFARGVISHVHKKLNTPLDGLIPGADAGILIVTTIASVLAFSGVMMLLIKEIAAGFVDIVTSVPNFEFQVVNGVDSGNFTFLMFSIFRDISFYFFIFVFFLFGILLALKQAQLVTSETLKNMIKSAFVGIIIIMIFPYIWDPISDVSEMSSVWMLNPLYSFDKDNPCIVSSDPRVAELVKYQTLMKERSSVGGIVPDDSSICDPALRSNYLFAKAIFGASVNIDFKSEGGQWWNVFDQINAYATTVAQGIFGVMFEGITKTAMLFFLATMSALVGSMRYLLTDVIVISLPILLALRSIPVLGIDKLAGVLLGVFVPLLFVPFFTALIITAGSTSLLEQEVDVTTVEGTEDLNSLLSDRYLFWVYAVATLSLAVMTPVMFVPMLSSVSSMVGKMVMTGTMTGVMGAASAVQGLAGGGASAMKGLAAGGSTGALGTLKALGTGAGLKALAGGMSSGGVSGAKNAFRNDLMGSGKIMPGAGIPSSGVDTSESGDAFHKGFIAGEQLQTGEEVGQHSQTSTTSGTLATNTSKTSNTKQTTIPEHVSSTDATPQTSNPPKDKIEK